MGCQLVDFVFIFCYSRRLLKIHINRSYLIELRFFLPFPIDFSALFAFCRIVALDIFDNFCFQCDGFHCQLVFKTVKNIKLLVALKCQLFLAHKGVINISTVITNNPCRRIPSTGGCIEVFRSQMCYFVVFT